MVKVRQDITGWVMKEHGIPDSRLTVIRQVEDYIEPNGRHRDQWLCECNCEDKTLINIIGKCIKSGHTKSCGCLQREIASDMFSKENRHDLSGEYGVLWSANTDEEIYFDLDDAEIILQHTWHIDGDGYAKAMIDGKLTRMHQLIGCKWFDHINRNKKDNRKSNLRKCTRKENARNVSMRSNNTSGFIGVSWCALMNKWYAQIVVDGKVMGLGYFVNKTDAVIARLRAENQYFKDFAPQRHLFEQYGIT